MNRFFSETTKRLTPYVPGEQPKTGHFIKLNTNENPYPPTPGVEEILRTIAPDVLRLYPDPVALELRQSIAKNYDVDTDSVFVGNGSDEVLAFLFQAFFGENDIVAFPDITYSFYPVYAGLYNIPFITVPLTDLWTIDLSAYPEDIKGLIIANPNAPTGIAMSAEKIEMVLKARPDTLIVIDEAYADFGAESVIPLTKTYDHLLVVKTMSKSRSFAGMRVGYAIGNKELLEGLIRVKDSFNSYPLDVVAQKAANASFLDKAYFIETVNKVIETRERFIESLCSLNIHSLPSKSNFVFVSVPGVPGKDVMDHLRSEGVLVRYFHMPRLMNWVRITIGTDEDMIKLTELLHRITVNHKIHREK